MERRSFVRSAGLAGVLAAGVAVAAWLSRAVGGACWPTTWPLVAQLGLALAIAEFPQYWLHRWQHEYDLLWRFHATHHSAPRLYWLNAARFHPVDIALLFVAGYLPLVALGCPEPVIVLYALFDAVFGARVWDNLNERCLACGNCTNVCPTCYCFNIKDELDLTLARGIRYRVWDSCQLEPFARVAGGINFRKERSARQRHRYYRKFRYPVDRFARFFCTGCGRTNRCTADCQALA